MKNEIFKINNIPAILWGKSSNKVIIAVHGNMSNKADVPIEILAKIALLHGYQVLSFDLPEHGDRKSENTPCKVQYCVQDLTTVIQYVKQKWEHISLFANSMGAYFSLLAYHSERLEKAWFLSPVVDMQRIIENMMKWFNITEEQLKHKQAISTPIGQNLYWDYYCYVKERPINDWKIPTSILYGSKDDLCEMDIVSQFAERYYCELEIVQGAEHYFHTPEQLQALGSWMEKTIEIPV